MNHPDRPESAAHWDHVYRTKSTDGVSWFQASPTTSLELVAACALVPDAPIVDVGAGASRLVDELLARGHEDVTVLDVSEAALAITLARLRADGRNADAVVEDVVRWRPSRRYGLWHDRAVFHFLIEPRSRDEYLKTLREAVPPGGSVIVGTFALDGPEKCSGLPVARYDEASLAETFSSVATLVETRRVHHETPWGSLQSFVFARFVRR
jgi:trans-aconitate methyltransferase